MTTPADMISLLEYAHPHIAARIQSLWGMPECDAYLRKLLLPIDYQPFEPHVAEALMGIQQIHMQHFPQAHDVWEAA